MVHRAKRRALAWYRRAEAICYLLNDSFLTPAGAPLGTPRVCEPGPGQLILDQTDGQFSIVAGEFTWPFQGTPAWGDQEWHALQSDGDEYDVLDQKKVILKFRGAWLIDDGALDCWFGFNLDTTPDTVANAEHTFYRAVILGAGIRCTSGASDNILALRDPWPVSLGEYFQAAIVLRPYTAGGLHWYPEAAGVFAHGAHFFWRDEARADSWRLAWYRQLQSRTDPLYPAFSNYDAAGKFDYVRIPCDDEDIWNPLFTPICWDEFTDNNGVILPNHTITYGPGLAWVNALGVWQITGNQADPDNSATSHAYVATLMPDVWAEVDADPNVAAGYTGMIVRKSANTAGGLNHYRIAIETGNPGADSQIYEMKDGVGTTRVNADLDPSNDWHNIRVRCDDEQMTVYLDYVEVLHYAAAWFNKHATWHGLWTHWNDAARFDNFIVLPRGTGLTRICYDDFTHINGTSLDATTTEEGALAWVEYVGDWDIQGNEAACDATNLSLAYVESLVSDAWVTGRLYLATAGWIGLAVRKTADTGGGSNHWLPQITQAAGNDAYLTEVIDGVHVNRASADTDVFTFGTRYYMQVECDGQSITVYIDGTQRLQFLTATFNETATWHGLLCNEHVDHRFDQFRVTEIPALGEYDAALDSF